MKTFKKLKEDIEVIDKTGKALNFAKEYFKNKMKSIEFKTGKDLEKAMVKYTKSLKKEKWEWQMDRSCKETRDDMKMYLEEFPNNFDKLKLKKGNSNEVLRKFI